MFLPLRDDLPTGRLPVVTLVLIALNVLVCLLGYLPAGTQVEGSTRQISQHDVWMAEYGAIPCELLGNCANQDAVVVVDGGVLDPQPRKLSAQVDPHAPALTLITSMFLHGGVLHLLFNLMFLWVFGRNVEFAMRPFTFLCFYLLAGMATGVAQALVAVQATVPTVGASGAIAAVIGAYVFLYPRALVWTMVFPPFIFWLPAWSVATGWGFVQVIATWRRVFAPTALEGSVASMAHLTGLAIGLATAGFFAVRRNPRYAELHGAGAAARRSDDRVEADAADDD